MNVRIGLAAGGEIRSLLLPERATVSEACTAARIKPKNGDQLLLNGKPVLATNLLRELDTILVSQPIEGG